MGQWGVCGVEIICRHIKQKILSSLPPPFFLHQERTKNAQFIIISLRNNMFELADRLVGIYKTHNTTKSVTIDPYKMAEQALLLQQQQAQPTTA